MSEQFKGEVESKQKEMIDLLESITVDDLKSEGVTLSFGGKTFQFDGLTVIGNETVEEKLRKEFKDKLNQQQSKIREKINGKINQLLLLHQNKQQEFSRKEEELKRKYSEASMMPDINETHLINGLSVVKGNSNDELIWVYRAIYNPKFVLSVPDVGRKERKAIKTRLANRMKTPILIITRTKKDTILSIATKNMNYGTSNTGLSSFSHYHQTGPSDCWGNWSFPRTWKTPDDIIRISKDAEAVLETINYGSLANRNPNGLPRLSTLMDNLTDAKEVKKRKTKNNGIDSDIWST